MKYKCERADYNCMNCFYADECGDWLDDPDIPVPVEDDSESEETDSES